MLLSFTFYFCQQIYTEVCVCENTQLSSKNNIFRIDLIIIDKNQIKIIDYKTDKIPALHPQDISKNYLEQMKKYKTIIKKIYKNYEISTYILWITNCLLMHIKQ